MKGRKTKKLLSLLLTAALAVMMMTSVVCAATPNYGAVTGTSTTFDKYLVMPNDADVPNVTFAYSIAAGAAQPGSADELAVYAGNDSDRVVGAPAIDANQAVFAPGDSTTAGADGDGIANSANYKYATKTVTVDFRGVKYSEPGVYRYVITEAANTSAGISMDAEPTRTLDVNVIDDGGSLVISSYVMYYGTLDSAQDKTTVKAKTDLKKAAAANISEGDKCNSYVNKYDTQNIYIGKAISGNQASKDKYFKFTVTLTGAGNAAKIQAAGNYTTTSLDSTVNGATVIDETTYTNPAVVNTAADGKVTVVYYLQGGQYVELKGIAKGAEYTVAEADYSTDGYVATAASADDFDITDGSDTITFDDAPSGTIATADIQTGFTNTKQGTIPTGVILSVAGLLVVGIIAVIGFVFFGIRSKRRYDED
jgi:hypothetical protein